MDLVVIICILMKKNILKIDKNNVNCQAQISV